MSIETKTKTSPPAIALIEIDNKTKLRRKHKEMEKAARKHVMPGYPMTTKFTSLEQINEYLYAEKITCLLCGKAYKGLAGHLAIHGISADEYKERFGLPYRTGLTSLATKDINKANGSRPQQLRLLERVRKENPSIKGKRIAGAKKARISHAKLLQARANVSGILPPQREYDESDALKVIELIEDQGLTLGAAIKQAQLMEATTFQRIMREHSHLRDRLAAAYRKVKKLYSANPLHQDEDKVRQLQELRAAGMSFLDIGKRLGVSEMCALRTAQRLGIPEPSEKPLPTHCKRGHPYDENRKCNVCATEALRKRRGYLPRAEAAALQVAVSCSDCGAPTMATRLSMNRRKLCDACKKKKNDEAQKNAVAKNPEKYKEYRHQWYLKQKEKAKG